MTSRPSFLIFCVDQMQAATLGCAGHPDVRTPNLDGLAANGVRFARAYCDNPVCTPSRVSIMTGLSSRQHGVYTNGTMIPSNIRTVASVLRDAGYRTRACGKLHLQPWSHQTSPEHDAGWRDGVIKSIPEGYFGFEGCDFVGGHVNYVWGDYQRWLRANHPSWEQGLPRRTGREKIPWTAYYQDPDAKTPGGIAESWRMELPPELHYNSWIAHRSIDFLSELSDDEDFFLWCSFPDPHHPFAAPRPYSEMYDPEKLTLPDTWAQLPVDMPGIPRWGHGLDLDAFNERGLREMLAQTYGMITHVDDCIGQVMRSLREAGRDQSTVVAFIADHGDYLGGHHLVCKGMLPYEEIIRVPCIWRDPSGVKSVTTSTPASLLDLAPTVLDYAGISIEKLEPAPREGVLPPNLKIPWFDGTSLRSTLQHGSEPPERAIIVSKEENRFGGAYRDTEVELRCRTLLKGRYKLVIFADEHDNALYDLRNDPNETCNLWNDPDAISVKLELLVDYASASTWTEYAGRGCIAPS